MSCHCPNRLSLSMGLRGVAAGANPSLVSGQGQGTPWISRQLIAGPSLVSNVGFSISLKDTLTCSSALPRWRAGIWTSVLPITSRPALPAELQPPLIEWLFIYNIIYNIKTFLVNISIFIKHFFNMALRALLLKNLSKIKFCAVWWIEGIVWQMVWRNVNMSTCCYNISSIWKKTFWWSGACEHC